MDFIFQGFQSSLPFWVYLLVFITTSALAWWSYKSIEGIHKGYRYLLITLRSLVFFILLLLLINPFFRTETTYFENPRILVMLDNSESTAIEKSDYRGIESYEQVLDELNFEDSSSVDYNFFLFGDEAETSTLRSLNYGADQTNLFSALQAIQSRQSEASAAVLITDGIYTTGRNPVFETSNIDIPVFTIGLGDTTFQKDVLVSSVSTNSTGYLNSRHPVSATISSKGFENRSFPIELRKGDEIIDTETVTPEISNSSQEVSFELPLNEEGLHQYTIEIPELADEWTAANNVQRFSVDVQDARQQILSLAFEIHPDIKLLRSLLLQDQNTNLTNRTWLRGNRFMEGDFSIDPDTLDLAVIHGYPQSGVPDGIEQQLSELTEQVPTVIIATPLFDPQRFEQQVASLPVAVTGAWNYVSVSIYPEVNLTSHPIMELPAVTYDRLPSITAPIENINDAPGARKLFSSSFQGEETEKPVIAVQEIGNRRITFIGGFNWFRLNQNSNTEAREFVQQLWENIISWTATDPENELLEIQPAQTTFTDSEEVVINGYLNNERGEAESDGTIDISISSDSLNARFYTMENRGGGEYQLNLGTMPEDIYSFEATAQKEDRTLDTQSGEFAVASSNAEFVDINRNDQLLRQIAQRSGGNYVPYDSVAGFWDQLEELGLLDQQEEVQTNFFYPYQHLAWFVVVLVLLSGEWILRKYLSLP